MNSPLEAPEKQLAEETSLKPQATASVIDTSKMSAGKAAALDLAESSRDPLDERGSFASNLFIGRYDFNRIFPFPEQSAEDRAAGEGFLAELRAYLARLQHIAAQKPLLLAEGYADVIEPCQQPPADLGIDLEGRQAPICPQ